MQSQEFDRILRPTPEAEQDIGTITFSAHGDVLVIKVGSNDNITSIIKGAVTMQVGISINTLNEDASINVELASDASLASLATAERFSYHELIKKAFFRLNYSISQGFLTKFEQGLKRFKVPQDAYDSFCLARLMAVQDFELKTQSLEGLPLELKNELACSCGTELHDLIRAIPAAELEIIEKLAELTTQKAEIYFHFKALVKVEISLVGLADVFKQLN